MKPRLRWRREPRWTGLAAITQGERGYDLAYGDRDVAHVRVLTQGWGREKVGYYWSCASNESLGIEHRNTAHFPASTIEEAKAQAHDYIKKCLAAISAPSPPPPSDAQN